MLPLAERIPPPGHPYRFSTIAHADAAILGPLVPAEVNGVVDTVLAALVPARHNGDLRALDIGCGKGDLLVRLALRGVRGTGLDRNPWFLAEAAALASAAGVEARVEWRTGEAVVDPLASGVDIAACVGATGAIGGPVAAPAVLARVLRPGGIAVIGEACWRQPPPPDAAAAFGIGPDELVDLDATVARIAAGGLQPIAVTAASQTGWDAYEDAYAGCVERWLAAYPGDPDAEGLRAGAYAMRTSWTGWRRAAMGFVVVVARRPGG